MTLHHPFQCEDRYEQTRRIMMGEYKLPQSAAFSDDLKKMLRRMLTVEPLERASAEELLALPFVVFQLQQMMAADGAPQPLGTPLREHLPPVDGEERLVPLYRYCQTTAMRKE